MAEPLDFDDDVQDDLDVADLGDLGEAEFLALLEAIFGPQA